MPAMAEPDACIPNARLRYRLRAKCWEIVATDGEKKMPMLSPTPMPWASRIW